VAYSNTEEYKKAYPDIPAAKTAPMSIDEFVSANQSLMRQRHDLWEKYPDIKELHMQNLMDIRPAIMAYERGVKDGAISGKKEQQIAKDTVDAFSRFQKEADLKPLNNDALPQFLAPDSDVLRYLPSALPEPSHGHKPKLGQEDGLYL
jgi:hypothetical protein